MMKTLLKHKVFISKPVWLGVAIITFGLMSRTIIIHKGSDIVRLYQLWLSLFKLELYQGTTVVEIIFGYSVIIFVTGVVFGLAVLAGWLCAAVLGSIAVVIKTKE